MMYRMRSEFNREPREGTSIGARELEHLPDWFTEGEKREMRAMVRWDGEAYEQKHTLSRISEAGRRRSRFAARKAIRMML